MTQYCEIEIEKAVAAFISGGGNAASIAPIIKDASAAHNRIDDLILRQFQLEEMLCQKARQLARSLKRLRKSHKRRLSKVTRRRLIIMRLQPL